MSQAERDVSRCMCAVFWHSVLRVASMQRGARRQCEEGEQLYWRGGCEVRSVTGSGKMKEKLLFAQTFFKRPRALGSLVPSSRFLVRQIMDQVDWSARVIVEYGPG